MDAQYVYFMVKEDCLIVVELNNDLKNWINSKKRVIACQIAHHGITQQANQIGFYPKIEPPAVICSALSDVSSAALPDLCAKAVSAAERSE